MDEPTSASYTVPQKLMRIFYATVTNRRGGLCAHEEDTEMIITTTPNIEGRKISRYLGVVAGEAIMGANVFRDLFAGIRDIVGGRSGAYEKELKKAREIAFEEMEEEANQLGANAVVAIDIDYEVLGEKSGMLMVSVSGTAVVVE